MKFVDQALIYITAGKGGEGLSSFRKEKYVPRGGPNGGNGGDGGDVIIRATNGLSSLLKFHFNQHFNAEDGIRGRSKDMHGRAGNPLVIEVPCGSIIRDHLTDAFIGELLNEGDETVAAKGGRKGLGNAVFVSSTNQVPTRTVPATPGEDKRLRIELKLLADIGLVGFPNAGKSTFISTVSKARPKVADYPFTTLSPVLGVVDVDDDDTMVIADLPGLIEKASEGAGLGHQFLKHIERCAVILHLVDISLFPEVDPREQYEKIVTELRSYEIDLTQKKAFIAFTKCDAITEDDYQTKIEACFADLEIPSFFISSASHSGITPLLRALMAGVKHNRLNQLIQAEDA